MFGYLQELVRDGNTFTVEVTDVAGGVHAGSLKFDGLDESGMVVLKAGGEIVCFPWTGVASAVVNAA